MLKPDVDPLTQRVEITPLPPIKAPTVKPLRGKDLRRVLDEEAAELDAKTKGKKIPPARRLVRSSAELEQ